MYVALYKIPVNKKFIWAVFLAAEYKMQAICRSAVFLPFWKWETLNNNNIV